MAAVANAISSAAPNDVLPNFDILDLAAGFQRPRLYSVIVVDRIDAANLAQGVLARLHVTGLVHGARLEQKLFSVPVKFVVESRARLVQNEPVDPCRTPIS